MAGLASEQASDGRLGAGGDGAGDAIGTGAEGGAAEQVGGPAAVPGVAFVGFPGFPCLGRTDAAEIGRKWVRHAGSSHWRIDPVVMRQSYQNGRREQGTRIMAGSHPSRVPGTTSDERVQTHR